MVGFSGGEALEAWLRETAERVASPGTLRVGFLENATYPDGTSVAAVAAQNEFGGTIEVPPKEVPEREVTVYRKVDKNGDFVNGGRFVTKRKSNFSTTHVVPAHTSKGYRIHVPARPFIRQMIARNKGEWAETLGVILDAEKYNATKALQKMGKVMEAQMVDSIKTGNFAPLAASTVQRKGFDKPLIDTSVMWKSIDSEVK